MMIPYLINIVNDHKNQGEWKIYSGNTVTNYKTEGEWKNHQQPKKMNIDILVIYCLHIVHLL